MIGVIIQARLGSTRFPKKVLADISGRPMVWHVYNRASQIKGIDKVILAIPHTDTELRDLARAYSLRLYQGSPDDVLDRYYNAATLHGLTTIIRVTADCPLLDPEVCTQVLDTYKLGKWDYVSNCHPPVWPDGLDCEVLSYKALERAWNESTLPKHREHATSYIWERPSPFRVQMVWPDADYSSYRWTVDLASDLDWVRYVYDELGYNCGWRDVMALPRQNTLTRVIRM